MKNTYLYSGTAFLLSGSLLLGLVFSTIGNYMPHLTGWSSPPGKFATVLENTLQTFPFILSLVFLCMGLFLLGKVIFTEMKSERLAKIANIANAEKSSSKNNTDKIEIDQ